MRTEILAITGDPDVKLTTYLHDSSPDLLVSEKRPAVLVFPGGGYRFCSDREAEPIALSYMAEGFQAFVLRYSVKEKAEFPRPLNDAETALQTILENADKWHVDPKKIAVIGFSAGGHLAAALGTMGKIKPSALVLCYPCIMESIGASLAAPIPGADERVDKTTPPTFLFSTADDPRVPVAHTLAFASALDRAGVSFETHIYRHGAHGLSLAKPLTAGGSAAMVEPRAAQWFSLSADWLREIWGDFALNK